MKADCKTTRALFSAVTKDNIILQQLEMKYLSTFSPSFNSSLSPAGETGTSLFQASYTHEYNLVTDRAAYVGGACW